MAKRTQRLVHLAGSITLAALLVLPGIQASQASALDDMLTSYQQAGAGNFSAIRGKEFWATKHSSAAGGPPRSCSTCHSNDLTRVGKHARTGKPIKPMAPAVNPERLTDVKKMKKWLHRNCKWVLGRTCTAQEQGDILIFISTFK